MNPIQTTRIEPGNRIQLPADWAKALGLRQQVALEWTDNGILIRPGHRCTWDEIFATRFAMHPGDPTTPPDVTEISGDDLLF